MTYLSLNLLFIGIAFLFFMTQVRRTRWAMFGAALLPMLVLTAIFDNLIVAAKIVAYDPSKISGIMIGVVPVEDFAYTIVAILVVPTVWWMLSRKKN